MDREKTIKAVETCFDDWIDKHWNLHPLELDNVRQMKDDAIALLKEHEPKPAIKDIYGNSYCPWCSSEELREMGACKLHLGTSFCPYCGKPVLIRT